MKSLAYIANIRLPTEKAHGIQIVKTCESLVSSDLKVVLVVPTRKNNHKENPFKFYSIKENFSIIKVWCLDLVNLPFFKKIFFWIETLTFYYAVRAYIKKENIDIFYTRDLYIALELSKVYNSVYYEVHSLPQQPSSKYIKTWSRVKGIIVISQNIKDDLVKFGVDANKIIIARDAVDIEKFNINRTKDSSRKKLHIPKDKKIALYTGHLYKWKGAHIFAETAKELPELDFYIVGGTDVDLKRFKEKYNFKNLKYIGWQSHDEMPDWMNAVDVLILPNCGEEKISSHYTSPMKMFEYMASGTPIVASDLPSIREVLSEDNAVLVEAGNVVELANGIKKVLTQEDLSDSLVKQANLDVKKYDWESRAKEIVNFILK
ncbi:MAG: hypothetical protein A2725_01135 [Candidatus Magasanikbacteria bacterium RIFCSPHIGHO2_01_FULL_33_34]|uniref:Uncharacterized protein n=1 Tax=Candidatus Magasanikbacteria bacterium RIFCSPHIGHO2_01_FULL_33_34 TaxID=1798671 RepID=A0A1F6LJB6_9BACT|nr:MAG: hypothetical protein A2725_01135 [Candidatus Magasanikbacteria bacterium RIFCSPHIGHO2_01_FULL_33_34]OGH65359.1 MAG: hypothetical protein A3B83_04795 [Candidatus Magasanikbacteria bacterium RIFCSPHIGHO2_02_FULL_33_17]OGH76135.1 MAG: hypothetical protein A3A89_01715 [Candidatus Magasanikbacteria bacterium RIFCSPLOWO2_01_FULL_33_34]OGH81065.1 MAG: hypothetical protein A3F93_02785 [Candidatus Magasanikbacteria bacterium RIFCSPLOWO2_12_FULL_34_7]